MTDSKVSELTELTTFSGDETFYVVEDDDGTPVSRRVTLENLKAEVADGIELGYAEITSPPTGVTATTPATATAVTGLSVTPTIGTRPVMVEFGCSALYNATATASVGIVLAVDGTNTGVMHIHTSATANAFGGVCSRRRLSLSAGSHTIAIKWYTTSGTGLMLAGDGTLQAQKPAYVQVVEV